MAVRRVRVTLEMHEGEIFCHWRRDSADRDFGGVTESVLPGGSLHGIPYAELEELGTGEHYVFLDETVPCSAGQEPANRTEDDRVLNVLQGCLFMERVGELSPDEVFCEILLSITPKNVDRIVSVLPSSQIERLREYGKRIPAARPERDAMKFSVVSLSFGVRRVPDESLAAIREWALRGGGLG